MLFLGCFHRIKFFLKIIIPEEGDISSAEFLEGGAFNHEPRCPPLELCFYPADALDILLAGGGGEVEEAQST